MNGNLEAVTGAKLNFVFGWDALCWEEFVPSVFLIKFKPMIAVRSKIYGKLFKLPDLNPSLLLPGREVEL